MPATSPGHVTSRHQLTKTGGAKKEKTLLRELTAVRTRPGELGGRGEAVGFCEERVSVCVSVCAWVGERDGESGALLPSIGAGWPRRRAAGVALETNSCKSLTFQGGRKMPGMPEARNGGAPTRCALRSK